MWDAYPSNQLAGLISWARREQVQDSTSSLTGAWPNMKPQFSLFPDIGKTLVFQKEYCINWPVVDKIMCIGSIIRRSVTGSGDARLNSHFDWFTTGSETKPCIDRSKHIYSVIGFYRLNKLFFLEKSNWKIKRSILRCVVLNLAATNWYSILIFKHTNYLTLELGVGGGHVMFMLSI